MGVVQESQGTQEGSLAEAFGGMAAGVLVTGMDGVIRFANAAALRVFAVSQDEIVGQRHIGPGWRVLDAHGKELGPAQFPSERTRLTGESSANVRLSLVRGSAAPLWLLVSATAMRAPSGEATGVVTTLVDITSDHEEAARRSRETLRFERLTNAMPGALYQALRPRDGKWRFLYVSAHAESVLGVEPQAAVADSAVVFSRVHPDDFVAMQRRLDEEEADLQRAEPAGAWAPLVFEYRFERSPGEWRWHETRARATLDHEGVLYHGFTHDITDRRRLEEQLRLTQSEEIIGQLAAGLAHNFNNLLAAILPNLEMIRTEVPERVRAEVDDAHRAATNAADLMRQLMQLVRHETVTDLEAVDISHVVHQVVRICRRTFDRGIRIVEELPPETLVVRATRSSLEQVLLNLCLNARDALEEAGDPQLRVRLRRGAEGGHAVIEVEDTGLGMPPEVLRRLGEPFFTTKPVGRGTGLGLASAYGIIRELRGRIEVQSTPGAGTRFELVLPLADAPARAVAAPNTPSAPRGHKVLVVDDEMMVRATAGRLLGRLGCEPILVADGAAALRACEAHADIKLAIVDLSMPGMSGAEVLVRLKGLRPTLPVVICSGYVADTREVARADALLPKPFDSTALASVLARLLPETRSDH